MKPTDHPTIVRAKEAHAALKKSQEMVDDLVKAVPEPDSPVAEEKSPATAKKQLPDQPVGKAVGPFPSFRRSFGRDKVKLIGSEKGWRLVVGSETLTLDGHDLVEIALHPDGSGRVQISLEAHEVEVTKAGQRKPRRPRGSRGRGGRK